MNRVGADFFDRLRSEVLKYGYEMEFDNRQDDD
jgi:hypothetical protein